MTDIERHFLSRSFEGAKHSIVRYSLVPGLHGDTTARAAVSFAGVGWIDPRQGQDDARTSDDRLPANFVFMTDSDYRMD